MHYWAKRLGIATGSTMVAVLHAADANKANLRQGDRIQIRSPTNKTVAILDVCHDVSLVPPGSLGIFEDLGQHMRVETGEPLDVQIAERPVSIQLIRKKLTGEELNAKEMYTIVKDIVDDKLTDIEKTYFVSACYHHELSIDETASLTNAMIDTGKRLHFGRYPIMDKHCIGGVAGNRTTAVVVPIIAAAGLVIPKTSSRSITSPAGTSDTMEVLCNVCLTDKEMKQAVKKTGGCLVWGGAMSLAPADDKIIKIEHPISLDPIGQMLASILAKKKSVSATHVLIDIPLGKGAKIEDESKALMLKEKFEALGKKLEMQVRVVITDGSQPIGNGIGPALEAKDILWTLQNDPRGSLMLKEKAIALGGILLEMGGKAKPTKGAELARSLIDSGKAYKKFIDMLKAQQARYTDAEQIPVGSFTHDVVAKKSGKVMHVDNVAISRAARLAGAPQDKGAGLYLYYHRGDEVKKGDVLYRLYAQSKNKLQDSIVAIKQQNGFLIH